MNIVLSNTTDKPIYQQIVEQIKELIIKGKLSVGESLPSMRILAKELRVSLITTKRAYEELEKDGFIQTVTGKGSFVKEQSFEFIKENNLKEIEKLMCLAVEKSKLSNISLEELKGILESYYEED